MVDSSSRRGWAKRYRKSLVNFEGKEYERKALRWERRILKKGIKANQSQIKKIDRALKPKSKRRK